MDPVTSEPALEAFHVFEKNNDAPRLRRLRRAAAAAAAATLALRAGGRGKQH